MLIIVSLVLIVVAITFSLKIKRLKDALKASDFVVVQAERILMRERVEQETATNPILSGVLSKFYAQTEKGIKKYPNTVNPDDYTEEEWLLHFQQEMIDGAVYVEALIQKRSGE